MGQEKIFEVLSKNKGQRFTSKQLSEITHVGVSSVMKSLRKMRKYKEVKCRLIQKSKILDKKRKLVPQHRVPYVVAQYWIEIDKHE